MHVHLFQKPVVFTTFTGKGPLCMLCKSHLWLEDSFCSEGLRGRIRAIHGRRQDDMGSGELRK